MIDFIETAASLARPSAVHLPFSGIRSTHSGLLPYAQLTLSPGGLVKIPPHIGALAANQVPGCHAEYYPDGALRRFGIYVEGDIGADGNGTFRYCIAVKRMRTAPSSPSVLRREQPTSANDETLEEWAQRHLATIIAMGRRQTEGE